MEKYRVLTDNSAIFKRFVDGALEHVLILKVQLLFKYA